jgi:hypothetical protein
VNDIQAHLVAGRSAARKQLPTSGGSVSKQHFYASREGFDNLGGSGYRSRFGHSDSSCRSEQSNLRNHMLDTSLEIASRPSLFCDSPGHVSNLPVLGSLTES